MSNSERNLGREMDEMRGRIDVMAEGQLRVENLLRQLIETLRTTNGTPASTGVDANEGDDSMNKNPERENNNAEATHEQPVKTLVNNNSEKEKLRDELIRKMQKQIKAIQDPNLYGSVEIDELFPEVEVNISKDFKIPEFSKYDGSTNPKFHLKTYITNMAIWSRNQKFLIIFFHESLTGSALEWYMQLDHSKISCWDDLTSLFLGQYRFNIDTAPTREELGAMQKSNDETFKQYAQRWRMLAAQVQPPLTSSEMNSYFMGTLGVPFIGLMAGAAYEDFSDLILVGERIEKLERSGKLLVGNIKSSFPETVEPTREEESEVSAYQTSYQVPLPIALQQLETSE